MLLDPLFKVDAADFFFALDHPLDPHREFALGFGPGFDRLNAREQFAFVVGGAAPVDDAIFDHHLERGGVPQIDRVFGLDVVVVVDHQRPRGIFGTEISQNDRRSGCFKYDHFRTERLEAIRDHVCHVTHAAPIGGNADLTDKLAEFGQKPVLVFVNVSVKCC